MAQTLVALYDSNETAQRVATDLERSGCGPADIRLSESGDVTESKQESGGFLSWLFGDDDSDRDIYSEGIRRGRYAVAVTIPEDRQAAAEAIMNRYSPLDIDTETSRWRAEGWTSGRAESSEGAIPVVEEQVNIGKRAIQRGGLRIYSRVVERPVSEEVTLKEESVNVERRPVDRPVEASDRAFQDRVIEMRETDEEAEISKSARVKEEVSLSKEERERREKVEDTERHTEVEVEHLQGGKSDPLHPRH